jgi:hypothetical protein
MLHLRMILHACVAWNKNPDENLIHFLVYQTLVFGPVPINVFTVLSIVIYNAPYRIGKLIHNLSISEFHTLSNDCS